jgi:UDP-3-O-[3-hydroxymyristoyl] glucosamine N-acyltransferase
MAARASEVAVACRGMLAGEDREVRGIAPLSVATGDHLAFHDRGAVGNAGVLLTRSAIPDRTCIVVPDPLAALIPVLERWFPEEDADPPVLDGVVVHPGARVGASCVIGEGTVLHPNVVVYPRTIIGRNCRIHAGTVVGAPGFRFHPVNGRPRRVPHIAGVVIGDDVEIGANCTIDRGFLEDTVIGEGCKLDAQVHVGHNVRLGRYVVIAAQTGISGSVRVGDGVVIGGQVGIADHAEIEAGARIGAQSGVHGRIPAGEAWLGTPAQPLARMRRIYAALRYLPELWRRSG